MPYNQAVFTRLALRVLIVSACFLLAAGVSGTARAQPTTACDPEYMDALEARAYLEAQREIVQNQNLILKPDSVFEYTCFDQFLSDLADNTNNFSESVVWGAIVGQGPTSLDTAFLFIRTALQAWVTQNFGNPADNYLARRGPGKRALTNVVGAHNCNQMAQVWTSAQCMDFYNQARDEFYDFNYYTTNEPRQGLLGVACFAPFAPSATDVNAAFNNQTSLYVLPQPKVNTPATFYTDDPVVTYLRLILPLNTALPPGPNVTCANPIPTGVCVNRVGMSPYGDAVCPNPGCHYQPPGGAGCGNIGTCIP